MRGHLPGRTFRSTRVIRSHRRERARRKANRRTLPASALTWYNATAATAVVVLIAITVWAQSDCVYLAQEPRAYEFAAGDQSAVTVVGVRGGNAQFADSPTVASATIVQPRNDLDATVAALVLGAIASCVWAVGSQDAAPFTAGTSWSLSRTPRPADDAHAYPSLPIRRTSSLTPSPFVQSPPSRTGPSPSTAPAEPQPTRPGDEPADPTDPESSTLLDPLMEFGVRLALHIGLNRSWRGA